jgi:hypothetical protein
LNDMHPRSEALEVSWSNLAGEKLESLSRNSGARPVKGRKSLSLRLIDRDCVVDFESRSIRWSSHDAAELGKHLQILVLHYLAGAGKAQIANRLVTFRDFEGGAVYYPAFKTRAIDRIVREFGSKPDILRHLGDAVRAEREDMATVGMRAYFFPKLPIVIALWIGDEEVPTSANILFDANAGSILPTEDLSVAAGVLVGRLVEISRG